MPCCHTLLQALDKLQSEWEAAILSVLEYRDTGTCVLKVREKACQFTNVRDTAFSLMRLKLDLLPRVRLAAGTCLYATR